MIKRIDQLTINKLYNIYDLMIYNGFELTIWNIIQDYWMNNSEDKKS